MDFFSGRYGLTLMLKFYGEFYTKESNQDFQDSPKAHTLGFQKLFKQKKKNKYLKFSWEWTKLEQESPNLIDNLISFLFSR
jgi:hypothetical protein